MRKLFLFLTATILVISLPGISHAFCDPDLNACVVFNETDQASAPYDRCGFRQQVRWYNAGDAAAICVVPEDSADEGVYDQGIYFMTPQWDFDDFFVNHVNSWITLEERISFYNPDLTLVIGQWSPYTIPATAYNYGRVRIDARTNDLDEVFHCGTGQKEVTLRNLVIKTQDGLTKWQMFEDAPCLRDGGAVYVCDGGISYSQSPVTSSHCRERDCSNNIDDDLDGEADCDDSNCSTNPACLPDENCTNNTDDDLDGTTDCRDADCAANPACEEICNNGIDDQDVDTDVDCADSECSGLPACEEPEEICTNGTDDDGDGAVDCADSNCTEDPACEVVPTPEDCTNGVDDDGDETVDCADPDCATNGACIVGPGGEETNCADGADDDGDGDTDCDDYDCFDEPSCGEPGEICDNDGDDDGDEMSDCDDPECAADRSCGGGGEEGPGGEGDNTDDDGDGFTENEGDCDDSNPTINPDGIEICDGLDNDCDELPPDETCNGDPEMDNDGDGFCEDGDGDGTCADGSAPGDCDDNMVGISPGAQEICADGTDNDCDGTKDEGSVAASLRFQTTEDEEEIEIVGGEEEGGVAPPDSGLEPECIVSEEDPGKGSGSSGGCGCDLTGGAFQPSTSQLALGLLTLLQALALGLFRFRHSRP